ncbi:MAG: hypothetical protein R6W68_08135, partial [Ignavibacteriaceae bacterium]
ARCPAGPARRRRCRGTPRHRVPSLCADQAQSDGRAARADPARAQLIDKIMKLLKHIIQTADNYITVNFIFLTSFVISIVFIISAVFLFDIGQDPAYFLNDIQNIEKYGNITRDYDTGGTNIYLIPNLPFNVISYAYVKLFGFSVIGIRFIIVFFTFLFIYSLYRFLEKDAFKISYILIFAIPGIYSLTSEVFLEISAICFLIFALIYLNKYEIVKNKRFEYFSIFFMVLAITTKFQLIPYLFLVFGAIIVIEPSIERRKFLVLFLVKTYILTFLVIIATMIPFGLNDMLVYLNWYFISGAREGRAFLSFTDIKLFMANEIIFIPLFVLAIYLYYKYSKNSSRHFSFHFLALFSIINVTYWLFFFATITWRNIVYANIFLCIMLATVLIHKKNYAKIILLIFFILGVSSNFIFLHHGVIDDIQFLREHYKRIEFARDDSQKDFFNKVSTIVESEANVYVPSLPYLSRVYLNNRRIILLKDFELNEQNKSYLIYDKEAFSEEYFLQIKEKVSAGDYRTILTTGDYYLFEILSNY